MQLSHSKTRATYVEQVKTIEANLKDATSGEINGTLLSQVQKRIDTLAEKYQYNDELGTARYKLYELQALVHYFSGKDDSALDFINQAIETRGDSYIRAEKLKAQLLEKIHTSKTIDPKKMTKQERRKRLIGLDGWLAFFVVGVSIGILLGVINLLGYGSTFSDLSSASSEAATYVSALTPVLWFEILTNTISISLAVWLVILLAKHKKLAKKIAIIYLVSSAVFWVIDYAWATSVFATFNVTQYVQPDLQKAAGDTGRTNMAVLIWVPYFLVSKRVRATLTK